MNDSPKHISPNVLCMNEIRIHLDRRQNIEYIKKVMICFALTSKCAIFQRETLICIAI